MSQPTRIWFDALEKVKEEGRCRVCGRTDLKLDAAHISGRAFDQPKKPGSKTKWVNPLDIVPLCGTINVRSCHGKFDAHMLDLLPSLTTMEQARAVELLGSLESARRRLAPSLYRDSVEGAQRGD